MSMSTSRPRRPTLPILLPTSLSSQILSSPSAQSPNPADQRFRDKAVTRKVSLGHDYSRLPPDELFSRFTVAETRTLQNRLRAEADAKQEELRLMVGERYRDLLQASTSVISISAGAKHVATSMGGVREACVTPENPHVQTFPHYNARKHGKDDAHLNVLQSLSAHLKLLLDAPEQLWRLLEQHNYLHAAWLFLISRVVYRNLVRAGDDDGEDDDAEILWAKEDIRVTDDFPLAQRQWDIVAQFRHQITHKATQDLRLHTRTPRETCDTLIAILLLDSISLSETLTLFLTQRSKALRTMFAKLAPLSSSSPVRSRPPSPFSIDRYQNQEITESILRPLSVSPSPRPAGGENSRESRRRRKEAIALVRDMLNQSLDLIVGTVETVRAIYGYEGSRSPPLVEQLLETVQSPSLKQPMRSRHRSRLSIISSFHATPSPIPPSSQSLSTTSILESLPSSQLLVQFLPPSITSYSPYIDTTSSASQLSRSYAMNSCASWFNGSLSSLEGKLRGWFGNLKTVQEVWEARSVIDIYRDQMSASEVAAVVSLVDEVCRGRAKSICQSSLGAIERQLSGLLTSVINGIRSNDRTIPENDPDTTMSAIPLPSLAMPTSNGTVLSFSNYSSALQNQILVRTPSNQTVLMALERLSLRLKKDIDCIENDVSSGELPRRILAEYGPGAVQSALHISETLGKFLTDSSSPVGEDDLSIAVVLFIGRIALDLAETSPFIRYLCRQQDTPEEFQAAVRRTYLRSLDIWRTSFARRAVTMHKDHVHRAQDHIHPFPDDMKAMKASTMLTQALLVLRNAMERLPLPYDIVRRESVAPQLIVEFVRLLKADMESIDHPASLQAQWDLAFMQRLLSTFSGDANGVVIEALHISMDAVDRLDVSSEGVKASLELQLSRWQLLLGPLVGDSVPLSQTMLPPNIGSRPSASSLLAFGAGPSSIQEDFQPALELVKPGPRLGLLLIGSGAQIRR